MDAKLWTNQVVSTEDIHDLQLQGIEVDNKIIPLLRI